MTPLAHQIVKQLTLPIRERTLDDRGGILKLMNDVHCFDTSEIMGVVKELQHKLATDNEEGGKQILILRQTCFLPAPKTWIEYSTNGDRTGFLLIQDGDGIHVRAAIRTENRFQCLPGHVVFDRAWDRPVRCTGDWHLAGDTDRTIGMAVFLMAVLAFINTPRLFGRNTVLPHRGLEKKLIAERPTIGKFPLHAWTEIKLSITPPTDMIEAGVTEAHLSGQKALHFVRAFLRIRLGRLEVVSSHWRGNGEFGIKQSRYKVAA